MITRRTNTIPNNVIIYIDRVVAIPSSTASTVDFTPTIAHIMNSLTL